MSTGKALSRFGPVYTVDKERGGGKYCRYKFLWTHLLSAIAGKIEGKHREKRYSHAWNNDVDRVEKCFPAHRYVERDVQIRLVATSVKLFVPEKTTKNKRVKSYSNRASADALSRRKSRRRWRNFWYSFSRVRMNANKTSSKRQKRVRRNAGLNENPRVASAKKITKSEARRLFIWIRYVIGWPE